MKSNVYYVATDTPLPKRNSNGVGVLIINGREKMLWGDLVPMPSLSEEQVVMTGFQATCIQAHHKDWNLMYLEIVNRDIFNTIRL